MSELLFGYKRNLQNEIYLGEAFVDVSDVKGRYFRIGAFKHTNEIEDYVSLIKNNPVDIADLVSAMFYYKINDFIMPFSIITLKQIDTEIDKVKVPHIRLKNIYKGGINDRNSNGLYNYLNLFNSGSDDVVCIDLGINSDCLDEGDIDDPIDYMFMLANELDVDFRDIKDAINKFKDCLISDSLFPEMNSFRYLIDVTNQAMRDMRRRSRHNELMQQKRGR